MSYAMTVGLQGVRRGTPTTDGEYVTTRAAISRCPEEAESGQNAPFL